MCFALDKMDKEKKINDCITFRVKENQGKTILMHFRAILIINGFFFSPQMEL